MINSLGSDVSSEIPVEERRKVIFGIGNNWGYGQLLSDLNILFSPVLH